MARSATPPPAWSISLCRRRSPFAASATTASRAGSSTRSAPQARTSQDDINGSESYGGRLSALWAPSDAFSLRLTAIAQDISTDASSSVESDANTLDTLYGRLSQSQYVPEFNDVDYRLYNATLDWDLGFATLTSATSYNEFESPFRTDVTLLLSEAIEPLFGPNEGVQEQTTKYDKVTQELRLASHESDSFEWLAGAYYTKEKGDLIQHFAAVTPGTLDEIPVPPVLVPVLGDTVGDLTLHSEYEEIAAFVSGTIHFGPKFDVTLGGRYSENDQEAKQDAVGLLAGGAAGVSFPLATSSEDVFTYSVAPKFKINEHTSLYARAATGFRPGGPNVLPPGAPAECAADL